MKYINEIKGNYIGNQSFKDRVMEDIDLNESHLWWNDFENREDVPGIQIIWVEDSYLDQQEINAMILFEDTVVKDNYDKELPIFGKKPTLFEFAWQDLQTQEDIKRFILNNVDCILLDL